MEKNEALYSEPGHPSSNRLAMLAVMPIKRYVQFYHRAYFLTMTECKITGGHRLISVRFIRTTAETCTWSDNVTDSSRQYWYSAS